MDNQTLVNEIRKTLTSFIQDICKVNMAMLIKDIDSDTYTFLLSSKLLDLLTPYDGTKLVAEYFYKNLSKEEFKMISRMNIVHTSDPSIFAISRAMNISNSIASIKKCTFFNVHIEEAIIFESHRE